MRKASQSILIVLMAACLAAMATPAQAEDTLAKVLKRGVLVAGVKDSLPPFGFVDQASRRIVGYDVDLVAALAVELGVRLELKPVTSASRIPQLTEGNIDIIAATMTKTPERAEQIDFSYTYFQTGQKFLVKKGTVNSLQDLAGKKIGTAKGSTSERNAAQALPGATIIAFDDYPQAFLALTQGKVVAVTTDESILAGLLAKAPNRTAYEITPFQISEELYGMGVRKGDHAFLKAVNQNLLALEADGRAKAIHDRWFGSGSDTPMPRGFIIAPD